MRSRNTDQLSLPKPPPVLTKPDFVRRYEAGEFGNHSPSWNTLEEFLDARRNPFELVHIRSRHIGGLGWYDVPAAIVRQRTAELGSQYNLLPSDFYFSLMCPTERTTIQGEVMEWPWSGELRLFYSDVKKPMRQSLSEGGRQVGHIAASTLLQNYLNPRSLSWLHWLLSGYPNHVIEFTCLSRCWGSEPGFNTLFWEVRRY